MNQIEKIKELIKEADAIVIGAGAGLSSAAGFIYDGDYFLKNFNDIYVKYGYRDMYSAGFHEFQTSEEKWGYWARFIYLQRYKEGSKPLYQELLSIVQNKNYFVITTNVDHQFQLAGFDKKRLFYTQGDYGLFQCSIPCHNKTYDNKESIMQMYDSLNNGLIPTSLIPKCPICGSEMTTNLRSDDKFVEDEGWHLAASRYEKFLQDYANKRILFLELGVGWNTPVIIKYPFMRMTKQFKNAFYVCINKGFNKIPDEIKDRSLVINDDLATIIRKIKN